MVFNLKGIYLEHAKVLSSYIIYTSAYYKSESHLACMYLVDQSSPSPSLVFGHNLSLIHWTDGANLLQHL